MSYNRGIRLSFLYLITYYKVQKTLPILTLKNASTQEKGKATPMNYRKKWRAQILAAIRKDGKCSLSTRNSFDMQELEKMEHEGLIKCVRDFKTENFECTAPEKV